MKRQIITSNVIRIIITRIRIILTTNKNTVFPEDSFSKLTICSFGIGSGQNLLKLANIVNNIYGYDVSAKSVENFKILMSSRYDGVNIYVEQANVCDPIVTPTKANLVIYDWFAYYVTNRELDMVKKNLNRILEGGGYLLLHDFLARDYREKVDKRNSKLKVIKRDIKFWLDHFSEFDLLNFNLYDCNKYLEYIDKKLPSSTYTGCTNNDDDWVFCALMKHRNQNAS